jgi:nicotinate phosphoribosyltransferase
MSAHTATSFTDLYQLTMAAGYWAGGRAERATFELFVRRLPPDRNYLLVAGLDSAAEYLENLRFTGAEIDHLRVLPVFSGVPAGFFEALAGLRFTGDMWAMPEGTPVFPHEPVLVVRAPIMEAQLVETALLAVVNFPISVASKAARLATAAGGRSVVEFGARRAHGPQAANTAARAAFIGGCSGTSNVEAGMRYGLPVSGTVAHSWIMSFDDEAEAFRAYQRLFPGNAVLLIDTYDTLRAAERITEVFAPGEVAGVRLDSGDLGGLARGVRDILDRAGFASTRILASGDLNERSIAALLAAGAPIDAFGVGTDLTTVRDAPSISVVYKLVELGDAAGRREMKMKLSAGKSTYPGQKQVWRHTGADGRYAGDTVCLIDEPGPDGAEPLLAPFFESGRRLPRAEDLPAIRERAAASLARLPGPLLGLDVAPEPYPVRFSDRIRDAQRRLAETYGRRPPSGEPA